MQELIALLLVGLGGRKKTIQEKIAGQLRIPGISEARQKAIRSPASGTTRINTLISEKRIKVVTPGYSSSTNYGVKKIQSSPEVKSGLIMRPGF